VQYYPIWLIDSQAKNLFPRQAAQNHEHRHGVLVVDSGSDCAGRGFAIKERHGNQSES
jgi:hypothetical protein